MWGEITYPFPNFNSATVEVWEWICNFISHFMMDAILHRDCCVVRLFVQTLLHVKNACQMNAFVNAFLENPISALNILSTHFVLI